MLQPPHNGNILLYTMEGGTHIHIGKFGPPIGGVNPLWHHVSLLPLHMRFCCHLR